MNQEITRLEIAIISGLKAFVISGATSVGVLFASGLPVTEPHLMLVAVSIAFLTGGIKGLEKAYNYTPNFPTTPTAVVTV